MLVTQAEAARHVNVSKQRVNKLVKDGRIAANAGGQVELEAVLRHFKRDLDPSWPSKLETTRRPAAPPVASGPGEGVTPDLADDAIPLDPATASARKARARREEIQAATAEFDLQVRRGMFLPRRDVEEAMVTTGRLQHQLLDAVSGWADELYALAAGGGSAQDLRRLLKEKTRLLKQAMADALTLLAAEDAPDAHAGA